MIRSGIPLRLALLAGLFAPASLRAQDVKPAPPSSNPEAADPLKQAEQAVAKAKAAEENAKAAEEIASYHKRAAEQALKAQAAQVDAFQKKADALKKSLSQSGSNPKFPTPAQAKVYTPRRVNQPRNQGIVQFRAADPLAVKFGLTLARADDALRAQLALTQGEGVVVVTVKPESLADQSGLKPNDVITGLLGAPALSVEQVRAKILELGKGALPIKLIREGKSNQISLVGPEHGTTDEPANFWIGVPVTPVDATLRTHVQGLPEGVGLVANDVVADSPAAKAGLKKFDILESLGDKPLRDQASLIAAVQATQGKPATLDVVRAGQPVKLDVTPVRRGQAKGDLTFIRSLDEALKQSGVIPWDVKVFTKDGVIDADIAFNGDLGFPNINYTASGDSARVEAILKEVKGLVEDVRKLVEAINKKPEGK